MRQGSVFEMALGLKASMAHEPAQYGRKMPFFFGGGPASHPSQHQFLALEHVSQKA